jgi:uncharacterized protein YjbI with pentapeptide repeats
MEIVRDTPLEVGWLTTAIRPPEMSMLVVVKATFVLGDGVATLAPAQDPVSGELYWEDDPARSVRYPSDFALLKPRGECFVVGSCRPLIGPVERTVAAFEIGRVKKSFAVYGDRTWSAQKPVPFTEMPLCWERAFGGPGFEANPLGRGIAADANGDVWLPNLELEERPITARDQRPPPAGAFPIGMTWPARQKLTGTYDERWQKERAPWLPDDFRFAFFNEAPEDQRIDGYWAGDEGISLVHLHPSMPRVQTRLPRVLARAFAEREGGAFEEIGLVLDTITIDADRGLASCVWRGHVDEREGIARLYVAHEALAAPGSRGRSIDEHHAQMTAWVDAQKRALAELVGEDPPPLDDPNVTIVDGARDAVAAARAAAQAKDAADRIAAELAAGIDKLKKDLGAAGIDAEALLKQAQDIAPPAAGPMDVERMRAIYEAMGSDVPPELDKLLDHLAQKPEGETIAPPPPRDLRALVIEAHRATRSIRGDFSGANLSELDLRGLDAREAILADANLRGANLTSAKLDGANLCRADFLRANLTSASLRRADLTQAILEEATLVSARLDDATLDRAELAHAVLDDASLEGADLTDAVLERASLVSANCDGAVFNGAKMASCRCVKASFVEARIYGASARDLELDHADLTRARIGRGADLSGSRIKGAKADGSIWRQAILANVSFTGTTLRNADFTGADLQNAQFAGCPMRHAVFQEATLTGASFRDADVFEGSFRAANLTSADLRGANLYSSDFFRAYGEDVSLEGANVDGTSWERRS